MECCNSVSKYLADSIEYVNEMEGIFETMIERVYPEETDSELLDRSQMFDLMEGDFERLYNDIIESFDLIKKNESCCEYLSRTLNCIFKSYLKTLYWGYEYGNTTTASLYENANNDLENTISDVVILTIRVKLQQALTVLPSLTMRECGCYRDSVSCCISIARSLAETFDNASNTIIAIALNLTLIESPTISSDLKNAINEINLGSFSLINADTCDCCEYLTTGLSILIEAALKSIQTSITSGEIDFESINVYVYTYKYLLAFITIKCCSIFAALARLYSYVLGHLPNKEISLLLLRESIPMTLNLLSDCCEATANSFYRIIKSYLDATASPEPTPFFTQERRAKRASTLKKTLGILLSSNRECANC